MTAPALPLPVAETPGRIARAALAALLLLGLASSLLSFLTWWVSLDWALRQATGDGWPALHDALQTILPERLLGLLVAASRDASTITPLIALLFSWALARGAVRALRAPERLAVAGWQERRSYPFSPGFERTWVQLGLIGTLWSFLLLGGSMRSGTDPDSTIEILVVAFSTALLSTLAGVVGAYVLAPGAMALFRRLLPRELPAAGDASDLLDDLERGVRQLAVSTRQAAGALAGDRRDRARESLHGRLDDAGRAVERFAESLAEPRLAERFRELASEVAREIEAGLGRRLARLEGRSSANLVAFAGSLRDGLGDLAEAIAKGQAAHAERLAAALRDWQIEREGIDATRRARREEELAAMRREMVAARTHLDRVEEQVVAGRADLDAVAARMTRELRGELIRLARRSERPAAAASRLGRPRRGILDRVADRLGRLLGGE